MYAGRLELHLILQKSAWDRPRVPNFRSRRVIILVILIILVLWALAGILNLFTPILVSKNGPSGIEFTFHRLQSLYRLTLPHKTLCLYDSLPPGYY